jgi:pimeloyl-ACP methyl ester carboxylesterase
VEFWEARLGQDFYIVHFNRQPGVADKVFADNCERFLRNLYRTRQWQHPAPELPPGMPLLAIATADTMPGDALMPDNDLQVFVKAFNHAGFTGGINWYRNFSRNWHIVGDYEQKITQPTLMLYGDYDSVPQDDKLNSHVDDLTVRTFPCGHWIQQECPDATTAAMLAWLKENYPA